MLPEFKLSFILDNDTSYQATGAVQSQSVDGSERVIAYARIILNASTVLQGKNNCPL